MKITIDDLKKMNACEDGVTWFQSAYPNGFDDEWTFDLQLKTLRSGARRWLGWAWQNGLLPVWSMHQVDLREADLREADLSRADLSGAGLREANLRGADHNKYTTWPKGFESNG